MTWLVHAGAQASTSTQFGGADTINKISNLFSGVLNVDTVDINSSWKFRSGVAQIANPANTFNYNLVGAAIAAARNLTLPLIAADDSLLARNSVDALKNKDLTDASNIMQPATIADNSVTTSKLQDGAVTSLKIAANTIADTDVSPSAAIAYSKLALANSILNSDISASAAIAKSKLAALNIANADVSSTAAIAYSKLALSASIVNADISATAAIAKSKLASLGIVDADVASGAAIAKSKLAALAIVDSDISSTLSYSKLNLANSVASSDLQATHPNFAAMFFPSKKRIGVIQTQAAFSANTGYGTVGGLPADAKTGSATIAALTPSATVPLGVQWLTGTTSGSFGGGKVTGGYVGVPVQNFYLSSRFRITTPGPGPNNRFWLGLQSGTTPTPTGDEPLASLHGIYFGYRTSDTTWIVAHNNASATSNFETGILAAYDNTWHTIKLWTDDAGVHWKYQIDGGTIYTSNTTQLPTATTPLYFFAGITNVDTTSYTYQHAFTTFISDSV